MSRQHIHLAPSLLAGPIIPRPSSTLYIYLDLSKLLNAGIPVFMSGNGVVLTPGDGGGSVGAEMFRRVERRMGSEKRVVWEDGIEVGPERAVDRAAGTMGSAFD